MTDSGSGSSSCAGACCAVFPLDRAQAARIIKYREKAGVTDAAYIADMLIPLTKKTATERYKRLGYGDNLNDVVGDMLRRGKALFTCRHWSEETRLCTAYDSRPRMCRDYPYGSPCERGCGYTYDPKAEASLITWTWDEEAKGWRLGCRSTDEWEWSEEEGVARARPALTSAEAAGDGEPDGQSA